MKNCRSENAAEKLASQLGVRYTVLFEMCVIDPMHNLFLGTAKRVFSKWIEEDIITKAGLEKLQERIEDISSLSDIGRLPGNIKSNYGGYSCSMEEFRPSVLNVCSEGCTPRSTSALLAIFCFSLPSPLQALHYKNRPDGFRL